MIARKGFTIIEVMVAVLVFTVGLIGAYVLVKSAMSLSLQSKQEILSANLLREQIELVKNVRDTNYLALRNWNSLKGVADPALCPTSSCELTPGYYTIENAYDPASPIRLKRLSAGFDPKSTVKTEANAAVGNSSIRLCLDSLGRYTHSCAGNKPTPYYSYVRISPVNTASVGPVPSALEVAAYLDTTEGGYREFAMYTILTDWKK